jgi:hypothetical protein
MPSGNDPSTNAPTAYQQKRRSPEVDDDFRPTFSPAFYPTVEEDAEAAGLLNDESEPDYDALAEESDMMDRYLIGCYAC